MIKFGTGGWRAVIGDDFICTNIRKVAAGILKLAEEQGKTDKPVVIGYDRRFLSDSAAKWVAEVLAAGGMTVWFLNRSAPTPLVMHTVKNKELYFESKSPQAIILQATTASSSLLKRAGCFTRNHQPS